MEKMEAAVICLLTILLFLGGLGLNVFRFSLAGVLTAFLLVLITWRYKKNLSLPANFPSYLLFLFLFEISIFLSQNRRYSLGYLALYIAGGGFWIVAYNLRNKFTQYLDKMIVVLGIIFGGFFLVNNYFFRFKVDSWSLFLPYTHYNNHNNIGDYWALVMVVIISWMIKKVKIWHWPLLGLGWYFLLMSQSRAAYVALIVGLFYLGKKKGLLEKYKKYVWIGVLVVLQLFLINATQKTTLFTRQYYIQALAGLWHHPWGVGVGSFDKISSDPINHLFGLSDFSSVVHNVILEFLSGMGILGISFLAWLIKVSMAVWQNKRKQGLLYRALFFALLTNFLFHSTYFQPTMLWLWFIILGLSQTSVTRKD